MTLEERVREKIQEAVNYWLYNQDKLRAPMFRRFCDPVRWEMQWRDLWRVIQEYEKFDGELGYRLVKIEGTRVQVRKWTPFLQSGEFTALQRLIDLRCTPQEKSSIAKNLDSQIKTRMGYVPQYQRSNMLAVHNAAQHGAEDALLEAFGIEYRREYQLALDKADRLWMKSGKEYFVEFAIIECGIIDVEQIRRDLIHANKPKLSWSANGDE